MRYTYLVDDGSGEMSCYGHPQDALRASKGQRVYRWGVDQCGLLEPGTGRLVYAEGRLVRGRWTVAMPVARLGKI